MKQIINDIIPVDSKDGLFHQDFQDKLDFLNFKGKKFNVEEYFNDNFSIFILRKKIYSFKTSESILGKTRKIFATINEINNIEELYAFMLRKKNYLDVSEIKEIFNKIKIEYEKINLKN